MYCSMLWNWIRLFQMTDITYVFQGCESYVNHMFHLFQRLLKSKYCNEINLQSWFWNVYVRIDNNVSQMFLRWNGG